MTDQETTQVPRRYRCTECDEVFGYFGIIRHVWLNHVIEWRVVKRILGVLKR